LGLLSELLKFWHDDMSRDNREYVDVFREVGLCHGFVEVVLEGGFQVGVYLYAFDVHVLYVHSLLYVQDLLHSVSLVEKVCDVCVKDAVYDE
jgi:hypothetical protein